MSNADSFPWSKAAAPIWGLCSGYEHSVRIVKPLAFLQVFSDDSASDKGDRRLFVAGYLNWSEQWAAFSDAWAEQLRTSPPIDYLKMVEAQNLRGQFKGWSEQTRNKKLLALAGIIEQFNPISFQFSISRVDFDRYLKPNAPRPLAKPHFDCIFGIICMMANFSLQFGLRAPIDFIFDEQEGVSADVNLFFEQMISPLAPEAKKLINGKPIFRDDKQFMPLQAADMLAWHLRREHETAADIPLLGILRNPDAHLVSQIQQHHLKAWADEFREIPSIPSMQGKHQWAKIRREMVQMVELGFIPPSSNGRENTPEYIQECLASIARFNEELSSKK